MSAETEKFQQEINRVFGELESVLQQAIMLRKRSPNAKGETAKIIERAMIDFSRRVKQLGRENQDDLMEGISLLKIKMMS